MLGTIALGALVGSLVSWIWGAISWMALPWHHSTFRPFRDEEAVARALEENAPASGIYGIPAQPTYSQTATKGERAAVDRAAQERLKRGPLLFAVVLREGYPPIWRPMLGALLIGAATAAVFTAMLLQAPGLTFAGRVAFVGAGGLAGAMLCRLPDWNWHGFSTHYTAVAIADATIGWTLVGCALAWVVGA